MDTTFGIPSGSVDDRLVVAEQDISSIKNKLITATQLPSIPAGSNLNNYTTGGVYLIDTDAIAATVSNVPRTASGKLIVIPEKSSTAYVTHEYYPTTGVPMKYVRKYNSSSWTAWQTDIYSGSLLVEAKTTSTASISAESGRNVTVDVSKNGYTPIGIVGWVGSGTYSVEPREIYLSGTTAYAYVRNLYSSALNVSITFYVLYILN